MYRRFKQHGRQGLPPRIERHGVTREACSVHKRAMDGRVLIAASRGATKGCVRPFHLCQFPKRARVALARGALSEAR